MPIRPAVTDDAGERAGRRGARGNVTLKFDYTHLGPKGAELFAAMIAEDLAATVPQIAGLLVP